jgi:hypothetical protein
VTSKPRAAASAASIVFSSVAAPPGASKMTLPLAMNVSTDANPSDSKTPRSTSIFTVRPPTLIARSSATYRSIAVARGGIALTGPRGRGSPRRDTLTAHS